METFLIIAAGIFILAGLVGSFKKKLPGTILSYLGIVLLHYSSLTHYSVHFFIRWGLLIIAIQGLDYFLPEWGKRRFGGSKRGVWGSLIGLLAGMYFGKWGIVSGAIIGAFVGELFSGKKSKEAIYHHIIPFIIFILGTISQLIITGIFLHRYLDAVCCLI